MASQDGRITLTDLRGTIQAKSTTARSSATRVRGDSLVAAVVTTAASSSKTSAPRRSTRKLQATAASKRTASRSRGGAQHAVLHTGDGSIRRRAWRRAPISRSTRRPATAISTSTAMRAATATPIPRNARFASETAREVCNFRAETARFISLPTERCNRHGRNCRPSHVLPHRRRIADYGRHHLARARASRAHGDAAPRYHPAARSARDAHMR